MEINSDILCGLTEEHLVSLDDRCLIHRDAKDAYLSLAQDAKKAGFELSVASSFRGFERQSLIWNEKVLGKRDVLDAHGNKLDTDSLNQEELIHAILRWSALPGASRHHWGTELDVFDKNSLPEGYQLQLTPEEYSPGGVQADFNSWLSEVVEAGSAYGFTRPYSKDHGGVAPEPWHLSYSPIANEYAKKFNLEMLTKLCQNSELALRDEVLKLLPELYQRYVAL